MSKTKIPKLLLFTIKFFSGAIIYFLIRLTYIDQENQYFDLDGTSLFYLIFTSTLVYLVWEINDWSYRFFQKKYKHDLFNVRNLFKYQVSVITMSFASLLIGMYLLHFHLSPILGCEWTEPPASLMVKDFIKAIAISLIFNLSYLIIVFVNYKRNADLNEEKIKKENLLFKYESLRNQIDPHFLFNSFSVLNTLIQTNANLASDFLNNLSDLYRYILDNKDNNLTSVADELDCLQHYLFLMKIRHEGCLESDFKIDTKTLKSKIPTMALQMLIENAIKHNSFSEKKPLKISIINTEDYLVISNPLNARRSTKISTGIGLENIKNRYKNYTNKAVIIEKSDKYFVIKIPLLHSTNFH